MPSSDQHARIQEPMNPVTFGVVAIITYCAATYRFSRMTDREGSENLGIGIAACAIFLHAASVLPTVLTTSGLNLGIFNAASLIALLIATAALITLLFRPVFSLLLVILPFSAAIVGISLFFTHDRVVQPDSIHVTAHIALSLIAYSLFAIATLQACYLAFAEHRLKHHTPVFGSLPPLPVMEQVLFQLTAIAFVLLSVGLVLGSASIEDIRAQHLSHKIFFSVLAWVIFAVLLTGRYRWHWRGRRAVRYVASGFILLAIGFFGSKIALELVLERV